MIYLLRVLTNGINYKRVSLMTGDLGGADLCRQREDQARDGLKASGQRARPREARRPLRGRG